MSEFKKFSIVFKELQDALSYLTESELEKVASGGYQLSIRLQKKKVEGVSDKVDKKSPDYEIILNSLSNITNREDGMEFLNSHFKTKSEMERFARAIDVAVMKSDKLDRIRDNIIESTIGARLRSEAIQNKA
ncbi:hypothetical protein [Kosakonia cowanii]|uniref:hypothetical protein n=1 Tax=Kosakonia cowanii TaxID=208223 RepID=UPI0022E49DEB|nr:hypothetical protein [Kosakonia cowanii]